VAPDDLRNARAGGDRGLDIGLLAQRQHDAAHQARDARDLATVMAMITFCTEARVSAISAIASRIGGIDISPSMTRITG
jgi:hypothetical protein